MHVLSFPPDEYVYIYTYIYIIDIGNYIVIMRADNGPRLRG